MSFWGWSTPLPFVDLEKTATDELEKTIVRSETVHAKWTGSRFISPRVLVRNVQSSICCVMPPYLVKATSNPNGSKTVWSDENYVQQQKEEHMFPSGWRVCRHLEPETRTLYITEVQEQAGGTGQTKVWVHTTRGSLLSKLRLLHKPRKVVKFRVVGKENKISRMSEYDIDWPDAPIMAFPELLIQGGYLVVTMDVIYHLPCSSQFR